MLLLEHYGKKARCVRRFLIYPKAFKLTAPLHLDKEITKRCQPLNGAVGKIAACFFAVNDGGACFVLDPL